MLADNFLRCDKAGSCMMGDQLLLGANGAGQRMMVDNLMKGANGEGQRMIFDNLATKDNMSFGVKVPGMGSVGFKTADNFLRADSAGNVMMGDKLAMSCDS